MNLGLGEYEAGHGRSENDHQDSFQKECYWRKENEDHDKWNGRLGPRDPTMNNIDQGKQQAAQAVIENLVAVR
jgi:hypothetical protein